jgi:hypothetical protein
MNSRKSRLIFIVGIVVALAGVLLAMWISNIGGVACIGVSQEISSTSLQEIENFAHLKFTPSTTNVTMYAPARCYSRHFYIHFDIDPTELDIFVASTRIGLLDSQADQPTAFSTVPESLGWKLDFANLSLTGTSPNALDYQQSIAVDTSNSEQYSVYIVVVSHD